MRERWEDRRRGRVEGNEGKWRQVGKQRVCERERERERGVDAGKRTANSQLLTWVNGLPGNYNATLFRRVGLAFRHRGSFFARRRLNSCFVASLTISCVSYVYSHLQSEDS